MRCALRSIFLSTRFAWLMASKGCPFHTSSIPAVFYFLQPHPRKLNRLSLSTLLLMRPTPRLTRHFVLPVRYFALENISCQRMVSWTYGKVASECSGNLARTRRERCHGFWIQGTLQVICHFGRVWRYVLREYSLQTRAVVESERIDCRSYGDTEILRKRSFAAVAKTTQQGRDVLLVYAQSNSNATTGL